MPVGRNLQEAPEPDARPGVQATAVAGRRQPSRKRPCSCNIVPAGPAACKEGIGSLMVRPFLPPKGSSGGLRL